jgi:hypothetical protein
VPLRLGPGVRLGAGDDPAHDGGWHDGLTVGGFDVAGGADAGGAGGALADDDSAGNFGAANLLRLLSSFIAAVACVMN